MTNNEKIKQTSATLFKNKIQKINDTLKELELGQLQFGLEEKWRSNLSPNFIWKSYSRGVKEKKWSGREFKKSNGLYVRNWLL